MSPVVRYFGHEYEPALFHRGWRGFFIRVVASIISWLERGNERRAMHYLAKYAGIEDAHNLDAAYDSEKAQERARRTAHDLLTSDQPLSVPRDQRYLDEKTYRQARVDRTTNAFSAYVEGARHSRYQYRKTRRFGDREGDADPVEKT